MIAWDQLLDLLGYARSPHYRATNGRLHPETAHLFRSASEAGARGIYVLETSLNTGHPLLSPRPAVYLAEATDPEDARKLHRNLWNLGTAPFLIVRLPGQIRVYTGFQYSRRSPDVGLVWETSSEQELGEGLSDFTAESVDSGRIWHSEAARQHLRSDERVDKRLLGSLKQLGRVLATQGLEPELAHALIGKYVYLRYLRDRDILTPGWMIQHGVDEEAVFTAGATVLGLRKLVEALEGRFNGRVFPIDFSGRSTLKNKHVSWVASVFCGAEVSPGAPRPIQQLHLPFKAYDFRYIPVETLSAIYEEFLSEWKRKGAVYTPEILADYLLSEVESVKPLRRGMRVLDPACGSGVFLVLAYRRLIEKQMDRFGRKLTAAELRRILLNSIWGVERERDACYVAEFGLILTLLHYVEPRDLQRLDFKFPALHNTRIFESDFFDLKGEKGKANFWGMDRKFHWVVGNPPWIELKPETRGEEYVRAWIEDPINQSERPVAGKRVAEAFSWLVTDALAPNGVAGLLLPATSLYNRESKAYRQSFFVKHRVHRVTDFSNLREVLFHKRATLPAAAVIYTPLGRARDRASIVHHGPFAVNQRCSSLGEPWALTINESEVHSVSPYQAAEGSSTVWKLALWGTPLDQRAIERIRSMFPTTLKERCGKRKWVFREGGQLRERTGAAEGDEEGKEKAESARGGNGKKDELVPMPGLRGKRVFDTELMRESPFRLSIPPGVLEDIPDEMCYARVRGGKAGFALTPAPHLVISPAWMSYVLYSDEDFVIPPRTIGIAASLQDAEYLRAVSIYLSSSLVAYWLFFHAQQWGVFRQARLVSLAEVRDVPIPEFAEEEVRVLAGLHRRLAETEEQEVAILRASSLARGGTQLPLPLAEVEGGHGPMLDTREMDRERLSERPLQHLRSRLQEEIDEAILRVSKIPRDIAVLVADLIHKRLPLDSTSHMRSVTRKPTASELRAYARELREELDAFVMGDAHHRVTVTSADDFVECLVEITDRESPIPPTKESVRTGDAGFRSQMAKLGGVLRERMSQWVYVQRSLRIFDGPRVYLYKPARLVDWTRAQALNDAGDIIGEAIVPR